LGREEGAVEEGECKESEGSSEPPLMADGATVSPYWFAWILKLSDREEKRVTDSQGLFAVNLHIDPVLLRNHREDFLSFSGCRM
jgi:hypothetical protein